MVYWVKVNGALITVLFGNLRQYMLLDILYFRFHFIYYPWNTAMDWGFGVLGFWGFGFLESRKSDP